MKTIELGGGFQTFIDDEDHEELIKYRWRTHRNGRNSFYAAWTTTRDGMGVRVFMHKFLMGAGRGQEVDHINRNGLDNRKENLRLCTRSQNNINVIKKRRRLYEGPRGVNWHKDRKMWRARIKKDGREYALGYFHSVIEASAAYDRAAKELHGDFAILNNLTETRK